MPRIRCYYKSCVFLDDGYCSAASIELEPEGGCLTYSPAEDVEVELEDFDDDDWDDLLDDEAEEDLYEDDDLLELDDDDDDDDDDDL